MSSNLLMQECPGVDPQLIEHLKRVFKWYKATPGDPGNKDRYLIMSGQNDVIDYLEAVHKYQFSGRKSLTTTGGETSSVLDRLRNSGNPILEKLMEGR